MSLTRVHDDQNSLPSLVDISELGVVDVKDVLGVVKVVVECLVALDVDRRGIELVDFGSEVGHCKG